MNKPPIYIVLDDDNDVVGSYDKAELIEAINDGDIDDDERIFFLTSMQEVKYTKEVRLTTVSAPKKRGRGRPKKK